MFKTKRQHLGNLPPLTAFGNDLVFTPMYFWCGKQVGARYFPCVNHYRKFTNSFGYLVMFSSQIPISDEPRKFNIVCRRFSSNLMSSNFLFCFHVTPPSFL